MARVMGIDRVGQVTVVMHCGSRGFGHQICADYLKVVEAAGKDYEIVLPVRQLAAALLSSPEGQSYLGAMRCAANFAWANRQCITHWTRESFQQVFDKNWEELGIRQVYDVAHNIAKIERHTVDGEELDLCVHRKWARSLAGKPLAGFRATPSRRIPSLIRHGSVCNTFQ